MTDMMIDLPEHLLIPVNAEGQGPTDEADTDHESCWCVAGDDCPYLPWLRALYAEPEPEPEPEGPVTPTEYLVMEVLVARCVRLGEALWTFPTSVVPALRRLEKRGWVGWKYGIVEKTCMVHLTDAGAKVWAVDESYPAIGMQLEAALQRLRWVVPGRDYDNQLIEDVVVVLHHFGIRNAHGR